MILSSREVSHFEINEMAFVMVRGGGISKSLFRVFRTLDKAFVVNDSTGPKIAPNGEHVRIRIVTTEVSSRLSRRWAQGGWGALGTKGSRGRG